MQKGTINKSLNLVLSGDFQSLPQYDGNMSWNSTSSFVDPETFYVAVVNARSISQKLNDIVNLCANGNDIVFISETWETPSHSMMLEEMQEMNGVTWISRMRPSKRGGGVGIVVNNSFGKVAKLSLPNDHGFEVAWAVISPSSRPSVKIIAAVFYSAPISSNHSFKRGELQEYLLEMMGVCTEKFPSACFILGGDINRDDVSDLLLLENFKQVVDRPTRGLQTLDILITDLSASLSAMQRPLSSDTSESESDHEIPVIKCRFPRSNGAWSTIKKRKYRSERVHLYRRDLAQINWKQVFGTGTLDDWVTSFSSRLNELSDNHFPFCSLRVRTGDCLWFSQGLRKLSDKVKRVYKKEGNSASFRKLRVRFKKATYEAKKSFYERNIEGLKKTDSRQWHQEIGRLAKNGGRRETNSLPEVPGFEGLTNKEMANVVAKEMDNLTKHYNLIDSSSLKQKYSPFFAEKLQHHQVVKAIKAMKIPRGLHPNDPLRDLIKPLAELFAAPLTIIFNRCLEESHWPKQWKSELTHMIPKKKIVEKLKDLRPIALTEFWSKLLESIVRSWVLQDVKGRLSLSQYGGVAGVGTSEYLMTLSHQVLLAPEDKKIALMLAFDFSSAFNCLEHSRVIMAAEGLGVRKSVLALLANYLDGRTNTVCWGSGRSRPVQCCGGSGQGTLLSVLLFLITIDPLIKCLELEINAKERAFSVQSRVMAFVDDLTMIITLDPEMYPVMDDGVKVFSDDGRIRAYLDILEAFSSKTGMKLNRAKTAAVCFGFGLGPVSLGGLAFPSGDLIDVVDSTKLLGVILDSQMSFDHFVKQRKSAAMGALWSIQRLKNQGLTRSHLTFAYQAYVLSVLEYGIPPIYPLLTKEQLHSLESIQRIATRAILSDYTYEYSYHQRLSLLDLMPLKTRWADQFRKIALKAEKKPCGGFSHLTCHFIQ